MNVIEAVNNTWRCLGPCRNRGPRYGVISSLIDTPPSIRESWWQKHVQICGGIFEKIEGPTMQQTQSEAEKMMDWEAYSYSTMEMDAAETLTALKETEKYFPVVEGVYTNPISLKVNAYLHDKLERSKKRMYKLRAGRGRPFPDCSHLKYPWPEATSGHLPTLSDYYQDAGPQPPVAVLVDDPVSILEMDSIRMNENGEAKELTLI